MYRLDRSQGHPGIHHTHLHTTPIRYRTYHTTPSCLNPFLLPDGLCAVNPNFRTTPLSGICIQEMVLKRDADEKKKKIVFGKV